MNKLNIIYKHLLSESIKKKAEKVIIMIAIASFLLHLFFIAINRLSVIELDRFASLLNNPIAAIYTPFSFILIYEVYLLIYYLPKSTSIYIGKQYEIMALIIIRRIFKDMSNLKLSENWFNEKYDLIFMYDLVAIILLFFLIYKFNKLNKVNYTNRDEQTNLSSDIKKFIQMKKNLATFLVPIFLVLSIYSFGKWINESFFSITKLVNDLKDVNKIFFDDFFTILILVDVVLLLFSFLHSDKFSKVIRNSGFIISTIMIKLSFSTTGLLNTILIVMSVIFGIIILAIHNKYEKLDSKL